MNLKEKVEQIRENLESAKLQKQHIENQEALKLYTAVKQFELDEVQFLNNKRVGVILVKDVVLLGTREVGTSIIVILKIKLLTPGKYEIKYPVELGDTFKYENLEEVENKLVEIIAKHK